MTDDLVTLTRAEYAALVTDAECWRQLWQSEHIRDLLDEWREWRERRDLSASTAAMASLADWRAVASRPSFGELQRRRGRPVPYRRCDWKTCTAEGQPHRSPRSGAQIILCATHSHLGIPEDGTVVKGVAA